MDMKHVKIIIYTVLNNTRNTLYQIDYSQLFNSKKDRLNITEMLKFIHRIKNMSK